MRRLALAILVAVAAGCSVRDVFTCTASGQCVRGGETGRCEPVGFCSFADPGCAGGYRFGDFAGNGLSGTCVAPGAADAPMVVPDGPPADARAGADARPGADAGPDARPADAGPAADAGADARPAADAPPAADAGVEVDVNAPVVADTTLVSTSPTFNYGAEPTISTDGASVAIIRFDLGGVGAGTVETVELHIWTTVGGGLSRGTLQVFKLLEDWTEGTALGAPGAASWNERTSGVAWSGAGASGASRDPTILADVDASADATELVVALPPAVVQGWLAAPASNLGLVLAAKSPRGTLMLVSREGQTGRAPFLHIRLRR